MENKSMKQYPKKIYNTKELVQKYKRDGLIIKDEQATEDILNKIGFYRLRGYSFHLYDNKTKNIIQTSHLK